MTTVAVVLCWNDADRVAALLAQLALLAPAPDGVVVVDNGSAVGEPTRFEQTFPGAVVVRLAVNEGFAVAANRGIDRALALGAAEVWLLNTDIVLPPDALASLRTALASPEKGDGPVFSQKTGPSPFSRRIGMAGAVLTSRDGIVECRGGGRVSLWTGACLHAVHARDRVDYLSAACLLVRAEMLRDIGKFDEGYFFYWEDVELGFRAREAGWGLAVAEDCRVVHDEASTLGRWSAARWELLLRGTMRFLRQRAPMPVLAIAARLAIHSVTMLRHGRWAPVAGAWRALVPRGNERRVVRDARLAGPARS